MARFLPIWQRLFFDELKELVAGFVAAEENTGEGRCGGNGIGLLDAAHGHAGVHGFDDHCYTQRMQGFLDAVADLLGEAFLHLQTAREGFHHAGYLGKAGDLSFGDIGHMGFADEGKHVVLAQGEEFNVLDNDHVVVGLLEHGALDNLFAVLEIALRKELHGFGHALGGLEKTLAVHVLTQKSQDGLDVAGDLLRGIFVVLLYLPVCHDCQF